MQLEGVEMENISDGVVEDARMMEVRWVRLDGVDKIQVAGGPVK